MNQTYKILTYDNAYDMENAVNSWLEKGWETSGELIVNTTLYRDPRGSYEEIVVLYAQVMRRLPEAVSFKHVQVATEAFTPSKN